MGFDDSALNYFNSTDHRTGYDLDFIRENLPQKFNNLLDVATGAGHCASTINSYNKFAVDMSHNMLKAAKQFNGIENVAIAQSCGLPFRKGFFDIVSCRIAMHHFRDPQEFFNEVHRVLTSGGTFVLVDSIVDIDDGYLNSIEYIRDESHKRSYTVNEILDMAGLKFRLINYACQFKQHNFEEWATRLNPDRERYDRINRAFLDLPENIQKELCFVIENGKITSYTDKKGIFIFQTI